METESTLRAFGITAPCVSCTQLTGGHIHTTWRVDTAAGSFILQELRHENPTAMMGNIALLTEHVRGRTDVRIPQYYATAEGLLWEGRFRLMDCIPGESVSAASPPKQIEAAGFAFGRFDAALHGLVGLQAAYPGLHDTRAYLKRLHRLRLPEEHTTLRRMAATLGEAACALWEAQKNGLLPQRTVHGDTKGANVLLCGSEAAVIDLDTAGDGLIAYDYGDGIRSLAQKEGVLDRERFRAFTRGFLRGMPLLSEAEIDSLIPGIYSISAELAMRYLIDLTEGCRYFGKTPAQTVARVHELLTFALVTLEQENELRGEVQRLRTSE